MRAKWATLDDFSAGIAESLFRTLIAEHDALTGIHRDDGIFGDFKNSLEQCPCRADVNAQRQCAAILGVLSV